MRCIAERLLPKGHGRTSLQREIVSEKVLCQPASKSYHIYCSDKNPGALELLEEFAINQGLTLKFASSSKISLRRSRSSQRMRQHSNRNEHSTILHVTRDVEKIGECDFMLVYLTSQTWTRGNESSMFGDEVGWAMDADVSLLLAHEMIGVGGQDARFGCEFANFFRCDDGATPTELLDRGIYSQIAVALKGGEWRKTSMVMLAKKLAGSNAVGKEDADVLKRMQQMSRAVEQEFRMSGRTIASTTARGHASAVAKALAQIHLVREQMILLFRSRSSRLSLRSLRSQVSAVDAKASEV